jgi:cysteine desulfurase
MTIYLDHNATTPVRPEARQALLDAMDRGGNPSAVHTIGRGARAILENARLTIAKCMCAQPNDIIFTAGGTEADNLAIEGAVRGGGVTRIIHTVSEHEAVARGSEVTGLPVELMPINRDGIADLAWLADRLAALPDNERALVCLHAANNETGVIQPYEEAGRIVREAGALFHIDAVQALGKIPFDFAASGAHYAAVSAHKVGGPQGVGALILACDAPFDVPKRGGGQERGRRSGTENVPGAYAFAKALEACVANPDKWKQIEAWRDRLESELEQIEPGICILGKNAPRTPNTTSVCTGGWEGGMQVIALDLSGICVSSGSACSSGKAGVSKTWASMMCEKSAGCTIRISLGWNSTEADVDAFLKAWAAEYARVKPRLKEIA